MKLWFTVTYEISMLNEENFVTMRLKSCRDDIFVASGRGHEDPMLIDSN